MNTFERTSQLIGEDNLLRLQRTKVILFGVGGVGGWCAEALVRSGIGHLTMVDFDVVSDTNLNRQLVATAANVGQPKVIEMRQRLLSIVPEADIVAVNTKYSEATASEFCFDDYDYVIDAIDTIDCKLHLIMRATESTATLFSSMGAGRKLHADRIQVAEFWKVQGCPLARALRDKMKRTHGFPARHFQCVYSDEIALREGIPVRQGTLAHIVGTFGFRLADLVLNDILTHP